MKRLAWLSLLVSVVSAAQETVVVPALTFDEAVMLAGRNTPPIAGPPSSLGLRDRLPNVRVEVTGNTSRTLDLFSEGPFQVQYASSVLAFDYPLWDGGAGRARIEAVESKLRRVQTRSGVDDARFAQLLDAFAALYVAQKEIEVIAPLSEQHTAEQSRSARLLAAGEINNLAAIERSEIALAFRSRRLEAEARRIDAAARIRLLTGLDAERQLALDLASATTAPASDNVMDDAVEAATIGLESSRARLREIRLSSGFRAGISGFTGFGGAASQFRDVSSQGAFGVYGLRVNLSYPLFRGANGVSIAEAEADVAQSQAARDVAVQAARLRVSELRLREQTSRQRIELLEKSVTAAAGREESLQRLVTAGMRSETDLAQARVERIRRQVDLLSAQVERWRAAQLLARMTRAGAVSPP